MTYQTFYAKLGLSEEATNDEIKAAYRYLLRKWQPNWDSDSPGVCMRHIQELTEAYKVLSDPLSRYRHDKWIAAQKLGCDERPTTRRKQCDLAGGRNVLVDATHVSSKPEYRRLSERLKTH